MNQGYGAGDYPGPLGENRRCFPKGMETKTEKRKIGARNMDI